MLKISIFCISSGVLLTDYFLLAYDERQKEKREAIESRPIFSGQSPPSTCTTSEPLAEVRKKVAAAAGKSRNNAFTTSLGQSGFTASRLGIVRKQDALNKQQAAENVTSSCEEIMDLNGDKEPAKDYDKYVETEKDGDLTVGNADIQNIGTVKEACDKKVSEPQQGSETDKTANTSLGILGLNYDSSSEDNNSTGD